MGNTRKAAVAGTFYSACPETLRQNISDILDKAVDQALCGKAIIAPHAGLAYSGEIAASAYKPLRKFKNEINKVILIGPSHYVSFMGLAVPTSDSFETPLGSIPIAKELREIALENQEVVTMDHAHLQEHSLELHLPFLQVCLNDFTLLPLIIGESSTTTIANVLEKIWDDNTLIIASTDLSHYMTYAEAQEKDLITVKAIESGKVQELDHQNACGLTPVQGLLTFLKRKKLKAKLIDLRNSGDTSGEKDRVVGYASFICDTPSKLANIFPREQQQAILKLARQSLEEKLLSAEAPATKKNRLPEINAATFVTLKKNGILRGCIGSLEAHRKLKKDIIENTFGAAFKDPRFPVLRANELKDISISISLLSPAENMSFSSEEDLLAQIRPGIDGLILTEGDKRGTFLPSVWEEVTSAPEFLKYLKEKAGLRADYWSSDIQVERYTTICCSEDQFN